MGSNLKDTILQQRIDLCNKTFAGVALMTIIYMRLTTEIIAVFISSHVMGVYMGLLQLTRWILELNLFVTCFLFVSACRHYVKHNIVCACVHSDYGWLYSGSLIAQYANCILIFILLCFAFLFFFFVGRYCLHLWFSSYNFYVHQFLYSYIFYWTGIWNSRSHVKINLCVLTMVFFLYKFLRVVFFHMLELEELPEGHHIHHYLVSQAIFYCTRLHKIKIAIWFEILYATTGLTFFITHHL